MIEAGIYALLTGEPTISALVSDRVYPMLLPTDGTFPAITFQTAGGSSKPTLTTTGLQKWRYQFDCWMDGLSPLPAFAVRAALIKFLAGRACQLSDGTWATFQFISPTDFYTGQGELFRAMAEFYIIFTFPA